MDIKGYKCPSCGGTVKFDSGVQKMKCPFCDSEFERDALEEYQREIEALAKNKDSFGWTNSGEETWENFDDDDLTTGCCPSCGAELYGDKTTVAMVCPCCGNAQIVAKRLSGMLKPDYVIPFRCDKSAATNALSAFCKGRRLLPNRFMDENRIQSIQGVYVPFWLFDATADGRVLYSATRIKTWTLGKYKHIQTSYFSIVREGSLVFEKIPADGSEKMDDTYMDSIEPFDYEQMQDFHPSYLAGYTAEKYDVDAQQCKPRVEKRIKTTIESEFKNSVLGYDTVAVQSSAVSVRDGKASYSLLPVWTLSAKYKDENYLFMMNGQTGKFVGRLPVDNGKVWKYGSTFTAVFGVIFAALLYLIDKAEVFKMLLDVDLHLSPLVIALVSFVAAVGCGIGTVYSWKRGMDTVKSPTDAFGYVADGSLNYKVQSDNYLYSNTSKIAISR